MVRGPRELARTLALSAPRADEIALRTEDANLGRACVPRVDPPDGVDGEDRRRDEGGRTVRVQSADGEEALRGPLKEDLEVPESSSGSPHLTRS